MGLNEASAAVQRWKRRNDARLTSPPKPNQTQPNPTQPRPHAQGCDAVTRQLRMDGWPALSIHGDKSQHERDWVLAEFKAGAWPASWPWLHCWPRWCFGPAGWQQLRTLVCLPEPLDSRADCWPAASPPPPAAGKHPIMIATDVAARGLGKSRWPVSRLLPAACAMPCCTPAAFAPRWLVACGEQRCAGSAVGAVQARRGSWQPALASRQAVHLGSCSGGVGLRTRGGWAGRAAAALPQAVQWHRGGTRSLSGQAAHAALARHSLPTAGLAQSPDARGTGTPSQAGACQRRVPLPPVGRGPPHSAAPAPACVLGVQGRLRACATQAPPTPGWVAGASSPQRGGPPLPLRQGLPAVGANGGVAWPGARLRAPLPPPTTSPHGLPAHPPTPPTAAQATHARRPRRSTRCSRPDAAHAPSRPAQPALAALPPAHGAPSGQLSSLIFWRALPGPAASRPGR